MIVVDTSALAKHALHEEGWELVGEYLRRGRPPASLDHILKEVGNAIWKHSRVRGVISAPAALELYKRLLRLADAGVIVLEPEASYLPEAMRIALDYGVTLYDALYGAG